MRVILTNNDKWFVCIQDKDQQIISRFAELLAQDLGIPTPDIKIKKNAYEVRFYRKKARLIAWYLYRKNLIDLSQCDLNGLVGITNKDDEFLNFIGAAKKGNKITPNVPSERTLEWCHIMQKQLSYKTQPIFSNKGQKKYYYLYTP